MKLNQTKLIIEVRNKIRDCQKKGHTQQVAYSTYHDCLTQICFTCNEVLTNLYLMRDLK